MEARKAPTPWSPPLRAIRAFYHFWMMELYGDVPILDHMFAEDELIDRQPRAKVAEFIEKELIEILEQGNLSDANDASTYGKPNRWMAEALLVKLYLNWGVYTNPITTVDYDTPNEKLDECVNGATTLSTTARLSSVQATVRNFSPTTECISKTSYMPCLSTHTQSA